MPLVPSNSLAYANEDLLTRGVTEGRGGLYKSFRARHKECICLIAGSRVFLDYVALYPVLRDGFSVLNFVLFGVIAVIPVFARRRKGEQFSLSLVEMTRQTGKRRSRRYEDSVRRLNQLQQPKHGAFLCATRGTIEGMGGSNQRKVSHLALGRRFFIWKKRFRRACFKTLVNGLYGHDAPFPDGSQQGWSQTSRVRPMYDRAGRC